MPYNFSIEKQPSEIFSIDVDFAADLGSSETISTATITAIDTSDGSDVSGTILQGSAQIQNGDQTLSKIAQKIKAGTDGSRYKITLLATTSDSNKFEADIYINVKNL